jgi:hypothetical protein
MSHQGERPPQATRTQEDTRARAALVCQVVCECSFRAPGDPPLPLALWPLGSGKGQGGNFRRRGTRYSARKISPKFSDPLTPPYAPLTLPSDPLTLPSEHQKAPRQYQQGATGEIVRYRGSYAPFLICLRREALASEAIS